MLTRKQEKEVGQRLGGGVHLKKTLQLLYQRPIGQFSFQEKNTTRPKAKGWGSFEEKVTSNQRLGGLIHLKKKLQPGHKLGMGFTWKKIHYNKAKC
jgi:hypothetical protein